MSNEYEKIKDLYIIYLKWSNEHVTKTDELINDENKLLNHYNKKIILNVFNFMSTDVKIGNFYNTNNRLYPKVLLTYCKKYDKFIWEYHIVNETHVSDKSILNILTNIKKYYPKLKIVIQYNDIFTFYLIKLNINNKFINVPYSDSWRNVNSYIKQNLKKDLTKCQTCHNNFGILNGLQCLTCFAIVCFSCCVQNRENGLCECKYCDFVMSDFSRIKNLHEYEYIIIHVLAISKIFKIPFSTLIKEIHKDIIKNNCIACNKTVGKKYKLSGENALICEKCEKLFKIIKASARKFQKNL